MQIKLPEVLNTKYPFGKISDCGNKIDSTIHTKIAIFFYVRLFHLIPVFTLIRSTQLEVAIFCKFNNGTLNSS